VPCQRQLCPKGSLRPERGTDLGAQVGRNVKIHEVSGGVGVEHLKKVAGANPQYRVVASAAVVVLQRKQLIDGELTVEFVDRCRIVVEAKVNGRAQPAEVVLVEVEVVPASGHDAPGDWGLPKLPVEYLARARNQGAGERCFLGLFPLPLGAD